jgi:hypothetical protein
MKTACRRLGPSAVWTMIDGGNEEMKTGDYASTQGAAESLGSRKPPTRIVVYTNNVQANPTRLINRPTLVRCYIPLDAHTV